MNIVEGMGEVGKVGVQGAHFCFQSEIDFKNQDE